MRRGRRAVELASFAGLLMTLGLLLRPELSRASWAPTQMSDVRSQLRHAQNQLEQFYSISRRYPTLDELQRDAREMPDGSTPPKGGWGVLVESGIIAEPMRNPAAPGRSTRIEARPTSGAGWHYDEKTGRLGACYYDEESEERTPDRP